MGSLVPGAGSGAGLLDPYGWASLGVAAPAVPSAQGAGAVPVLPDSLVGVSAASGGGAGFFWFEVLGARVVDSRVARFTAPDPLAAPVGAGWGADPFSLVVVTRFLWWIRGVCRRCRWRILRSIVSRKRLLVLPVG